MIGIRTPFRVSFAGGSTDIPNFYKKYGGKVVSTSIDKYMYHFIHKFSRIYDNFVLLKINIDYVDQLVLE